MTKVIVKNAKSRVAAKARPRGVKEQRVPSKDGGWTIVRTLNAHSANFADDFLYVFSRNVAKARKENKQIIGSADGIPPKR